MRFGLFGGTFNPIHYGHLRAVISVLEAFGMDTIYLIPSASPPHKEIHDIASSEDRLEMVRLAIKEEPRLILSDIELKRSGPSYTIDTVKHFKRSVKNDDKLFLIVGMDAFLEIDTWRSFKELFEIIPIIVMARPYEKNQSMTSIWHAVSGFIRTKISEAYQFSEKAQCYHHSHLFPVFCFNVGLQDISGTTIRQCVKQGKSIRFLVPESVNNYILERGLYS